MARKAETQFQYTVVMNGPQPILPDDFTAEGWRGRYSPFLQRAEDSRKAHLWHRDRVRVSETQTLCLGEFIKGLALNGFRLEQALELLKGMEKSKPKPEFRKQDLLWLAANYGFRFFVPVAKPRRPFIERKIYAYVGKPRPRSG